MLLVIGFMIVAYWVEFLIERWQLYRRSAIDAQWKRSARLNLPGADHLVELNTALLRQFDLPAERVLDVCVINGPLNRQDITPKVMDLLNKLYEKGQALGLDTRELVFGQRGLAAGEGLYLISLGARPNLRCVAILAQAQSLQ